ncbi:MAG TPA: endolytic transglycosylase MltG [Thermoanaerobaculia bacterium]|nr:endolytic transglycosylase MltG [Thermoanaerobaculia bacterium]
MTILFFAVVLAAGGAYFFWRALTVPYQGFPEPYRDVEVHKGERTATILRQLQQQGVLRDEYVPLVYIKVARYGESVKAGVYRFSGPTSAADVVEKLIRGEVILKSITIREGLDRFAVARLFAADGFGKPTEWDRLTGDPELIRDLDPKAASLEGYLFPDTYEFGPGTRPQTIIRDMVQNFRKHFGPEMAYITTGLDVHDTVTLASVVETEAKLPRERPVVASVYVNRLRRHMLLDADPTVIYALKLAGRWDGDIHKTDLQIDSPYNTYRFPGLPPGPIANPGLASLSAAAAPAKSDFLYFVARHDGSHAFSTNITEHNRNVQRYQVQWYRQHPQPPATATK